MKKKTICDAIKEVLKDEKDGLTYLEIHSQIEEKKLYEFGAKSPQAVVHSEIRRHCEDLEFPSASPVKFFKIIRTDRNTNYYGLVDDMNPSPIKDTVADLSPHIIYNSKVLKIKLSDVLYQVWKHMTSSEKQELFQFFNQMVADKKSA